MENNPDFELFILWIELNLIEYYVNLMLFIILETLNLINGSAVSMKFKLGSIQKWSKLTFENVLILMAAYLIMYAIANTC